MNFLMQLLRRLFVVLMSLLWIGVPSTSAEEEEVETGVIAELWPVNEATMASPLGFEKWRSKIPPANGTTVPLTKLQVPVRETAMMVRVRGVIIPPQTGGYTVLIEGLDAAEFWMGDVATGEWKRIQRTGNRNTGSGRVKLEKGVAKRFEFWTMGKRKISVIWELATRETEASAKNVIVARQAIPASCMEAPAEEPDDRYDSGLSDEWKRNSGLDPESGDGPNSPWGDPDSDGLLNWQERLASTDPLKADSEGRAGLVRWEVWRNIPGRFVFDLTRNPDFPQTPDEVRYLQRLELPVGNGDDYGSRIRGLIKAPASGEYTFMVIANDTAELWLGENESWKTKKLVARMEQQGGQLKWTRGADPKPLHREQMSAPITLEKGKSYYLEVLHKQDRIEDHCSVAWVPPGAAKPEVIGADSLVSWAADNEDAGDDGLPDSWQESAGLMAEGVGATNRGSHADADLDGRSNWEEWKAGTDPLNPEAIVTEHMLTSESWVDLPGDRIGDLVLDKRFPAKPSHTTLVDNLDFSDEGNNYGCRLRGYLTAPDDGAHVFYISGNNACILYLSDSENKFSKRVIAQTTGGTGWRIYGQNYSQQSEPIELKKGLRYYIEVLYKRGALLPLPANQKDHSSVAWKRPGRLQTIIDAEYFSPHQPNTRDLDGDDLPDDWEKANGLNAGDPTGASGSWGDSDDDWLENFREFQLSLDPKTADYRPLPGLARWQQPENFLEFKLPLDAKVADYQAIPGFALWECWQNIPGKMQALITNPSFPSAPSQRKWVSSLEGPYGLGQSYGSRLRAFVMPPVAGDYVFAISGDNESELWLSSTDNRYDKERIAWISESSGYRKWDVEGRQISRPIRLQEGKRYYMEILHKQSIGADHVSVAWKIPGASVFKIIRDTSLAGFAPDPNDVNNNDLPDDWEKTNGSFDDSDNGYLDLDGDGLTNREEFIHGTRADLADSDADGITDFDELRLYGSNPVLRDVIAPVKVADLPLAGYHAETSSWVQTPDGALRSSTRRGAVDFTFNVENSGIFMVELQAAARSGGSYVPPIPVVTSIDGMEMGYVEINSGGSSHRWLTSFLSAGTHIVTIDNRNVRSGQYLEISSITLYEHKGSDTNENGNPDWMDILLHTDNYVAPKYKESATSPMCIEGIARYPGDVRITNGTDAEILTQEGLVGRWFANVPLDPSTETPVTASFESGTLQEEHKFRWIATNLFEAPALLRIRVGDSLKLTAIPPGVDAEATVSKFTRDGQVLGAGPSAEPRIVAFDEPGTYTLAANAVTGQQSFNASIQIEVVDADFGPEFSLASGTPRVWTLPNIPHSLVIEADPDLTLEEHDREAPRSRRFTVSYPVRRSGLSRVLARLWEGGPIAAATTVNAFRFVPASVTDSSHLIDIMADGTRVVEVRYVLDGPIPHDLSIWLRFIVTDAIFANGGTWYELTAADFDANGEARILIYKAPGGGPASICHRINPYFNDRLDPLDP